MKVSSYLDLKKFDYEIKNRPKSGENYVMICPFCGGGKNKRKTFAINANSGLWNCLRENECGKSGTFFQLQERLGDKPVQIDPYINKKIDKIKAYSVPKVIKIPLSDISIKYLTEERKFTKKIIEYFDLFEDVASRIQLPFYKNGIIVNIKTRSKYGKNDGDIKQCSNAEPTLFNIDNVKNFDMLIIVEGEYDCIALVQYGLINVVSIPSGAKDQRWIEHEWDWLDKFKEIYLVMDSDPAGQIMVRPIVNRLGIWRCKSVKLPYKDANECLKESVSPREILQCFKDAEEFTPIEIRTAGEYCDEVIDIFRNPEKYEGVETGIPELTKLLRGFRNGELTLWSGQSGSGKTTILNQCCLFLGSRGYKTCIASLELRPARYLKWAIEQALGKNNPTNDEIIKVFEWIDEWICVLDIEDKVYGSKILELFEYTARKYGISQFVIDSLMMIDLKGDDDNMNQVAFVKDYKKFGKRFGVHCHLVAHPKKQEDDKSKPGKADVKGRTELTDVADNVIIIWRNIDDDEEDLENEIRIDGLAIVTKNREFGTLGSIPLFFNPDSRRFLCKGQTNIFY